MGTMLDDGNTPTRRVASGGQAKVRWRVFSDSIQKHWPTMRMAKSRSGERLFVYCGQEHEPRVIFCREGTLWRRPGASRTHSSLMACAEEAAEVGGIPGVGPAPRPGPRKKVPQQEAGA